MPGFSAHRPVATGDGPRPLEASSWKPWGGHRNRISKPFEFRPAMRMPSWRHGGGAYSQPRGPLSLCTGRSAQPICRRPPRQMSSRDRAGDCCRPRLGNRCHVLEPLRPGGATGTGAHPALRDVLVADWLKSRDSTPLTRSGFSQYGQGAWVLASVIWGKPAFSRRPNFVLRRPSPTIQGLCVSPGRTAWTRTAPYGCSQAPAGTASSRKPLPGT